MAWKGSQEGLSVPGTSGFQSYSSGQRSKVQKPSQIVLPVGLSMENPPESCMMLPLPASWVQLFLLTRKFPSMWNVKSFGPFDCVCVVDQV